VAVHEVAQFVKSRKVEGSILDGLIGIYRCLKSLWPQYVREIYPASDRNEYQKYFLGG